MPEGARKAVFHPRRDCRAAVSAPTRGNLTMPGALKIEASSGRSKRRRARSSPSSAESARASARRAPSTASTSIFVAGEVHGLVGENGAGKSTLMRVLAGFFADYEGTIAIAGEPADMTTPAQAAPRASCSSTRS